MKLAHNTLRTLSNRWLYWIALGVCLSVPLVFGLTETTAHFDDAYITYRYARNLATGRGFVYNPGEAVLGMTTPLYGFLLALISTLGIDIPQASHTLSVIGWAACVILTTRIGQATGERAVGLIAAALVATFPLFLDVIGMETNLMMAVALAAIYLYLTGHTCVAFVLAALATWMRPDCALVAMVLGLTFIWERRTVPWREGVLFVLILLPWLVIAQSFYGSMLPNSLLAKAGQGYKVDSFQKGLLIFASRFYSISKLYLAVGWFAMLGLVPVFRRRPRWLIVVSWAALHVVSYLLLDPPHFPWYYLPMWPAIALLTATGIVALVRWLSRFRLPASWSWLGMAAMLTLVLVPQWRALLAYHTTSPWPGYRVYVTVADWLRANTPPDASVVMIEIGIIGYYSDRHVVDVVGLVSPGMVGHLYSGDQTLLYAVTHYWPDYAISLQGTTWDYIKRGAWFQEAYTPLVKIPSMGTGSRSATIYKRVEGFPIRVFEFERAYDLEADSSIRLAAIRAQSTRLQPDSVLHAQLEWRSVRLTKRDDKAILDLVNAQTGQRWTVAIEQPMHGGNPTFLWKPGDVILDDYTLALPRDLEPGVYVLEVKLLDVKTDEWLTFATPARQVVPHVAAGPFWFGSVAPAPQSIADPVTVTFGDSVGLVGFDLPRSAFSAGESVSLTLYWKARQWIGTDYTVFVHILDKDGNLVAQHDSVPVHGKLPTSLWVPDVTVRDDYQIELPPHQPEGEYTIRIGLYQSDTLERLMPRGVDIQVQDLTLYLARITLR